MDLWGLGEPVRVRQASSQPFQRLDSTCAEVVGAQSEVEEKRQLGLRCNDGVAVASHGVQEDR